MKRLIDFIASAIALIVFAPLFLVCYVAIRLEDGEPVIYRQERIGLHGKPFYIYKFRSMKINSDRNCCSMERLATHDLHAPANGCARTTSTSCLSFGTYLRAIWLL